MPDEITHYGIGELAKQASTTPRTIRYYTVEGLLPPPVTQGRYARYSDAHLRRLRLIQRLKNAYLPLATIRAQLATLSEDDMDILLAQSADVSEETLPVFVRAVEPHREQGQREYIAQILAVTGQAVAPPTPPDEAERPRPRALLVSSTFRQQDAEVAAKEIGEEQETNGVQNAEVGKSETWERVRLADGCELHVRAPIPDEIRLLIEATETLWQKQRS